MKEIPLPPLYGSRFNPVSGHYSKALTDFLRAIRVEPLEQNRLYQEALECHKVKVVLNPRPRGYKFRCMIVGSALDAGATVRYISSKLHTDPKVVRYWLRRFTQQGLKGLADKPRKGRPHKYDYEKLQVQLREVLSEPPYMYYSTDRKLSEDLRNSTIWTITLLTRVMSLPLPTVFRLLKKSGIELPKTIQRKERQRQQAELERMAARKIRLMEKKLKTLFDEEEDEDDFYGYDDNDDDVLKDELIDSRTRRAYPQEPPPHGSKEALVESVLRARRKSLRLKAKPQQQQ